MASATGHSRGSGDGEGEMSLTPRTLPSPLSSALVQGEVSWIRAHCLLLTAASPQVGESLPGLSLHPQGGLFACPTLGRLIQGGWVGEKVPTLPK